FAQQAAPTPNWDNWNFLIGKWIGEGSSDAGQGSGYFTFEKSLEGKALIRKNRADYPATKDRPAFSHEDLMIVYFDAASNQTRAFYTDSEGHVIQYTATWSSDGNTLTFLSDPLPASPRYRLTYFHKKADQMSLTFEIARPGNPDQFQKFIDATVRKSSGN
ncbi:MAG TPA: Ig-like domain-containing protein, partial [Candidatus Kapabacteria bacterium]|nr:Ig-like domain-containing protein [Candidatus Kapabacteria bacterium]